MSHWSLWATFYRGDSSLFLKSPTPCTLPLPHRFPLVPLPLLFIFVVVLSRMPWASSVNVEALLLTAQIDISSIQCFVHSLPSRWRYEGFHEIIFKSSYKASENVTQWFGVRLYPTDEFDISGTWHSLDDDSWSEKKPVDCFALTIWSNSCSLLNDS